MTRFPAISIRDQILAHSPHGYARRTQTFLPLVCWTIRNRPNLKDSWLRGGRILAYLVYRIRTLSNRQYLWTQGNVSDINNHLILLIQNVVFTFRPIKVILQCLSFHAYKIWPCAHATWVVSDLAGSPIPSHSSIIAECRIKYVKEKSLAHSRPF